MKLARPLTLLLSMFICSYAFGKHCQQIKVGSTNGWYPVTYVDPQTNLPSGIAHDLIQLIGERLALPIIIDTETPWKRLLHKVEEGTLDMVSAIYLTHERERLYRFTAPYYVNQARVFVAKGNEFPFNKLEDLKDLTGVIPLGGSFGDEFDNFSAENNLKLISVETKEQKGRMLLTGRADYFVHDFIDGTSYLNRYGLQDKIVALDHPISTTNVYFALSRHSPCQYLIPQINAIINETTQDGSLQAIIDQYLDGSYRY
ncbi:transporter substrate-binding domain-containing protein [Vibrio sp. T187]|uniref:substrate-binding periplasmic protein n=1 Tax=Vibrio TaxID=662 RepID=UPI0010C9ACE0|nr:MULTISPECIES: transporter substrate-binding domain-containing protein [Vibrio]MBW3695803.1 transporter substrate-binding domain-containing protein [Vibrio sp. T187]